MRFTLIISISVLIVAVSASGQDIPASKILVAKESWREVASGLRGILSLEGETNGTVLIYHDREQSRLGVNGQIEKLPPKPALEKITPSDALGVSTLYHIDQQTKAVHAVSGKQYTKLVLKGLVEPTSLTVWPDKGHLVIGAARGAWLWAVRLEADGSFGPGDRYYSLRTRPGEDLPVTALTMDANYLLYACTPLGVQVFDPTGRLSLVIPPPAKTPMSAITIGGENADTLFVASGNSLYARKIQGKAPYTLRKEK
jgi:hypothetical protein